MTSTNREEEELAQGLALILENYALTLRTITVGSVVSYDQVKQTASVQPLLKRKFDTDTEATLPPVIGDVQVATMGNGQWTATYDMQPGTTVVLGICDRSIQRWKVDGGEVDPLIPRHHNMTDAIILSVINAAPTALENQGPGIEIRKNDGSIRLRLDDAVYVTTKTGGDPPVDVLKADADGVSVIGDLSVTGNIVLDGDVEMTGDIELEGDLQASGEVSAKADTPATEVKLSTHQHPTAAPGGPSSPTPGT